MALQLFSHSHAKVLHAEDLPPVSDLLEQVSESERERFVPYSAVQAAEPEQVCCSKVVLPEYRIGVPVLREADSFLSEF
jgi:hypothetical protein